MGSADTAALVTVDGERQTIRGTTPDDVRASILATASAWASAHGEAIYLESTEDDTTWAAEVGPDGSMSEVPVQPEPAAPATASPVAAPTSAPTTDLAGAVSSPAAGEDPAEAAAIAPARRDGHITDAGLGIFRAPAGGSAGDANPFRRQGTARHGAQDSTGTVRVMVANTAGGAGKTPTLIGVTQALAERRGGEWVLVDLNPTGNLGDMAGVDHQAPLPDLIDWLHDATNPTRTQLQQHLAWSARLGCWIVTARETVTGPDGAPIPGPGPTGEQTRRVLGVLAEQFGLIGIDTGNNDLDWAYRVAAETADALVIATNGTAKAHAGALATVADLWDLGYRDLAKAAVVANLSSRIRLPGTASRRRGLDDLGLQVVDVPWDRKVAAMRPDQMGRTAQAAYARLAAALETAP